MMWETDVRDRAHFMVRGARGRAAARSVALVIPGMILVGVLLFVTTPLTVALCLAPGAALVLLGLLLWLRAGLGAD